MREVRRGDIYLAELNPVVGSERGGIRPVLIVQNDIGNRFLTITIVASITSQIANAKLPTHVQILAKQFGLERIHLDQLLQKFGY